ncbi:MAG: hypothetical protein MPJ50_05365 [Pirellulales bacterium]|nr:hypothetical protein [Pirellulales bacterium]
MMTTEFTDDNGRLWGRVFDNPQNPAAIYDPETGKPRCTFSNLPDVGPSMTMFNDDGQVVCVCTIDDSGRASFIAQSQIEEIQSG